LQNNLVSFHLKTILMAGAVISSILSLGSKLLSFPQSFQFSSHDQRAVEDHLVKLIRTLEMIKATLLDAEERQIRDRSVKLWLKELKRVAYAAEDVLDEYQYEILRTQVEGSNGSTVCHGLKQLEVSIVRLSHTCIISQHVVDRISEIRRNFDAIAKDRDTLRLREDDGVRRPQFGRLMPPPTSHFVEESSVFGRKKEKEDLVSLLLSERSEFTPLSVISIVGKGGLGKTTLAQIAFNDSRISERFDLIGWVSVLEDSDVKGLTQAIFESITGRFCDLMELSNLQKKLGEEVRGRSVFIVLDDVWNEDWRYWEALRAPLKMAKIARVLVTTRNIAVSQIMQSACRFPLGYLSNEKSWLLFKHHAFGNSNYNYKTNFTLIGKQIVKKCGGLPLAIKSVASLLRHEENYDGWEEILEYSLWESNAKNEIFPALEISYARMPAHLRPCFLFCSLYPKDYIFKRDQLIGLWIAQGFVEPDIRRTLEETGWGYLEELIQRSFIDYSVLPSDPALFGEANKVLKLHSVIHDLARFISENEHLSIDGGHVHKGRREVYHLYSNDYNSLVCPLIARSLLYLRTLILDFNNENNMQIPDLTKAEGLRAFGLHGGGRKTEIPDSIGNLKHLRYLCFSSCDFKMLPESICLLYNLQILIISDCLNLASLPQCIQKLVSLRYLDIRYSEIRNLPDSISLLNNLQTLIFCSPRKSELPEELGKLINLRNLALNGCSLEKLPESICWLSNLQSLSLSDCISLKELPDGFNSLKKLRSLDLNGSGIEYMTSSIHKLTLLERLNASLILKTDNVNNTIGLLEGLVNLKGDLCITGLRRVTNMADACRANLKNKQNITNLTLSWWSKVLTKSEGLTLTVKGINQDDVDDDDRCSDVDLSLLKSLQPHPRLKSLTIVGYQSQAVPAWLGDASACASIEIISIRNSYFLKSLNFQTFPSLKSLSITQCHQLQFSPQQSFPLKLEYLWIQGCLGLKSLVGLQNFHSLKELYLRECENLIFIEGLPCTISVLLINECKELRSFVRSRISSLKFLEISKCPQLQILADEIGPLVNCVVRISCCPILREWCQKNCIDYLEVPYFFLLGKVTVSEVF
jgi:Leucine-rich repeat (LRR) protein